MSYILDALRKSERERKLSQPASLDSMIFSPEPARRHPWLPWVLGAVAVANVAALGYFLGLTSGTPTEPQATASQSPPALAQEHPPKPTPAVVAQPPPLPAATVPPFARRFGGGDALHGGPHQHAPAAPAAKPAVPPPAPVQPAGRKGPETAPEDVAEEDAEEETMADEAGEAEEDSEAAEPARSTPPAPATPAPRRNAVPLLSEMPPSFQSRVPQLKINLYAYGAHPDERFVVINMNRHSAGDTVADGVRLESVDEDSLTLVFEGQRFRLERP
ncbi:general secretion pathway protein GspB [Methylococcus geothermalis]|uniref:General secretion pathway protein GspB n=1 Tax=Methylococcus geothermalis TaxID=2681310 RepID=A0A858Q546_9GAMM|nr:general secretion pathway protein GspB [Methylococcus geothermalis]QJD28972.1 general secretion pathway protein GspB [Methylococcus geothermalis]